MSKKQVRFIAKHTFKAEEDQDLPLEKGQLIYGNFLEDAWWVGEDPASGKSGVFPANFVVEFGSPEADKVLSKLAKKDPDNKHVLVAFAARDAVFPPVPILAVVNDANDTNSSNSNSNADTNNTNVDEVQVNISELQDEDLHDKDDQENDTASMDNNDTEEAEKLSSESEDTSEPTSSQEAAAKAAGQSSTTQAVVQSVWRQWKPKVGLAAAKCFLALLSFSCLAGAQFHNLDFRDKLTNETLKGAAPDAVWYIVTAVQFSIAWGILMWIMEFVLVVLFLLRLKGELPDMLQTVTDKHPIVFLVYDVVSLFMLSVAGFNMGAAASLPPKVIQLLIQTNLTAPVNTLDCSDPTIFQLNSTGHPFGTVAECPSPLSDLTKGTQNTEHLNISNLRAGVVMMLFLIWIIIVSIVQDYVWVLLGVPDTEHITSAKKNESSDDSDDEKKSDSDGNDDATKDNEKSDDKGTAVETEVVADGDVSGDDI